MKIYSKSTKLIYQFITQLTLPKLINDIMRGGKKMSPPQSLLHFNKVKLPCMTSKFKC